MMQYNKKCEESIKRKENYNFDQKFPDIRILKFR